MKEREKILNDPADYTPEQLMDAIGRNIVSYDELMGVDDSVYHQNDKEALTRLYETKKEKEEWESIKDHLTEKALRDFIERHPAGRFLQEANMRLEEVCWNVLCEKNKKAKTKAAKTELRNDINTFLKEFPNGPHVPEAHVMLNDTYKLSETLKLIRRIRKKEKEYSFTIGEKCIAGKHEYNGAVKFKFQKREAPQSSPLYGYRLRQNAEGKYSLSPRWWNKLLSNKAGRGILLSILLLLAAVSFWGGTQYKDRSIAPSGRTEQDFADVQKYRKIVNYINENPVWKESDLEDLGCKELFGLMNEYKLKDLREYMDQVNEKCNIRMSEGQRWTSLYNLVREKENANITNAIYTTAKKITWKKYCNKLSSFK